MRPGEARGAATVNQKGRAMQEQLRLSIEAIIREHIAQDVDL